MWMAGGVPPPLALGSRPVPLNPPPPLPMGVDDDDDDERAPRRMLSYWTPEEKRSFLDTFKVG